MTDMKSIRFSAPAADDMVRAILEDRKTVTRRVVKPQHLRVLDSPYHKEHPETPDKVLLQKLCEPPYHPGDILYVRETWNYGYCDTTDFEFQYNETFFEELKPGSMKDSFLFPRYFYRTEDLDGIVGMKWYPSIHMPREAARIFLRVTGVRVERLQEITNEQAQAEGVKGWMVATDRDWDKNPNYILAFRHAWNSTIKKEDRARYGWDADPWVWVIEFERCEKPEGD